MTEPITVILMGRPVPYTHAQSATGYRYVPTRQRDFTAQLKLTAQEIMRGKPLLDQPLRMELYLEFPIPKSWSKKKQQAALLGEIRHTTKPDNKNLLSLAEDALKGVVYRDDALIDEHHIKKRYGLQPKLVLTVFP